MSDQRIHIFNGFQNPHGGSELEALQLARLLSEKSEVSLWSSSSRSSSELREKHNIVPLGLGSGRRPDGGTYVFVGAHWRNKLWPYLVRAPQRLIYVFNTFHPKILALTSKHPSLLRWAKPEYVFTSEFQKRLLGVEGEVHPSPIDIDLFKPGPQAIGKRIGKRPVIGRLSRDTNDKHNIADVDLYRGWVALGADIQLQGATCLGETLGNDTGITLLPAGTIPAAEFLRSLDIFYYRTGSHVETFGRVVLEAMACALPVVCHRHGGYADSIRHGENGFLFETSEQAQQIVSMLLADPGLRASIGQRARRTVESMYSTEAAATRAGFFWRGR
ncbi:glycosyltransferase family 4 protein [Pararobbsia alpina]|uniref:D-inositol-3-phosphate glycosyltransferase n=1 Tax=Pararobbsia alpina TaxID=621374 RepID=A0A6S7BLG4_9BURK|nr:glycosyltransferase family 4 protein [Pararobbsia alpina]CAB3803160.1 D-inositol-3-phosphate glycosyltransferase [Pararobbsia alpina]